VAETALHVGIDARELLGRPTGVGRYLTGLLGTWAADSGFPHRLTLFLPAAAPASLTSLGRQVSVHVEAASPAGSWWEQTRLPRAAARTGVDVLLSPAYTAPLRLRCPSIVVIHDVSYFAHPEWFSWRDGLRRRWLTRASASRARAVITVSEFSAEEIVRFLGVPRTHLYLAPPGAPVVAPAAPGPARAPIVLYAGSLLNRRRIPELLQAFALLAPRVPDARLVLVGENRTRPPVDPMALAAGLGIGSRVSWRDYVSDDELGRLYATARVFAFLSDYEGFAMTPLEALAYGVPPVLLDTPTAREVYGAASVRVAPDPRAIADALVTLLTDDAAHARAVAAGRVRLAAHSWAHSAAVVRRILEQVVSPR
jgi:glycosyltransferase involved in cell wall biosynthesis